MTKTLFATILIESGIIIGYAQWRKKPLLAILLTGLFANLLTQAILWAVLSTFPLHYFAALFTTEILIVGIEFLLLYVVRNNHLKMQEAFFLSLVMNLGSFGIGLLMAA